tara:strand:- start:2355 stop:3368 length:1014 start_codon:yes stop_codon:yes gene_type:complete
MANNIDIAAAKLASQVAEICVESSSKSLLDKAVKLLPQMLNVDGFMILAEVENSESAILCSSGNTPKTIVFNDSAFSDEILFGKPSILKSEHIRDIDDRDLSKKYRYICSLFGGKNSTGFLAIGIKKINEELVDSQIDFFAKICQIVGNSYQIVLRLENDSRILKEKNRLDPLTNLLTHRAFLEELSSCMKKLEDQPNILACVVINLDAFTSINEHYGYEIGNELLFELGTLLQNFINNGDVLGRIGGDEFGVVLNNVGSAENAILIVDRLRQIFNKRLLPLAKNLTASIGIALYPQDSVDNEALIAMAVKASKEAKKISGTHSAFYGELPHKQFQS